MELVEGVKIEAEAEMSNCVVGMNQVGSHLGLALGGREILFLGDSGALEAVEDELPVVRAGIGGGESGGGMFRHFGEG